MSRSTTPTYRIEFTEVYDLATGRRTGMTPSGWRGQATAARLLEHLERLNASFLPGGCNDHCGRLFVATARLVRQATGREVAEASYATPALPEGVK